MEEPFPEEGHKTAESHALVTIACAAETASSIFNVKLDAQESSDACARLSMRPKHEPSFFPDETEERVGNRKGTQMKGTRPDSDF